MTERERLQELHIALEGAVDQLGRAHRIAVGEVGHPAPEAARIDRAYADVVALRNDVRDRLLAALGRPAPTGGGPAS
jgi:hypothetical protein